MYFLPPEPVTRSFAQTGGTVVALPFAFVWDVATFPFQWIWGVHPYGGTLTPELQTK